MVTKRGMGSDRSAAATRGHRRQRAHGSQAHGSRAGIHQSACPVAHLCTRTAQHIDGDHLHEMPSGLSTNKASCQPQPPVPAPSLPPLHLQQPRPPDHAGSQLTASISSLPLPMGTSTRLAAMAAMVRRPAASFAAAKGRVASREAGARTEPRIIAGRCT